MPTSGRGRSWLIGGLAIAVASVLSAAAAIGITRSGAEAADPEEVSAARDAPIDETTTTAVEQPDTPMDASQLAAAYGDAVVRVEVDGCGVTGHGTGWAIDSTHFVTNWHVVNVDADPVLVTRSGATIDGRVIGWSEQPDIAVIRVDAPEPTALSFADTASLAEGQDFVALGYPAPAGDFSVTEAGIVSFQKQDGRREAIRSDGALDRGNSGGPVLTQTGEVAAWSAAGDMIACDDLYWDTPVGSEYEWFGNTCETAGGRPSVGAPTRRQPFRRLACRSRSRTGTTRTSTICGMRAPAATWSRATTCTG